MRYTPYFHNFMNIFVCLIFITSLKEVISKCSSICSVFLSGKQDTFRIAHWQQVILLQREACRRRNISSGHRKEDDETGTKSYKVGSQSPKIRSGVGWGGGGGGTGRNQAKNYGFYALLSIFFFFVSFLYSPVVVHFMIVLLFFQRMILSLGKKRENISPFRFMYSPKEKDDEAPNEEEGHWSLKRRRDAVDLLAVAGGLGISA